MASPLHVFRKHQKKFMIVFGILLMISFLVVGILPGDRQNQETAQKVEVVAVWDQGEITDDDIYNWRRDRIYSANLVQSLMQQALEKKLTVKGEPIESDTRELALIQTILLARKAKDEQIEISKEAVRQYLSGIAGEGLTDEEIRRQLRAIGDGRFTLENLFGALERELLARNMYFMMNVPEAGLRSTGEFGVPPMAAWGYFNRLHRRAQVELLPVHVEDYLDKAPTPTDEEIQKLYDEYKFYIAQPGSFEPGFRIPRKIAFQWLKSDGKSLQDKLLADYVKQETPKVTDKEIQEYYERNKFQFQKKPPADPDSPPTGAAPMTPAADAAPMDETAPADAPMTPATDSPTTDSPAPAAATPDSAPPADSDSTEPSGEQAAPAEEPANDAPPGVAGRFDERLFVVAQEESSEAPAASAGDAVEPPGPEATSPEGAAPESTDTIEPPAPEGAPASGKAPAAPPIEYEPLESVKDKIRESIAREKATRRASADAQQQMNKRIDDAQKELKAYSRQYKIFLQDEKLDEGEKAKPPKRPNFADLAKKHGLTSGQTAGPLDAIEIAETQIGKAGRTTLNASRQGLVKISFAQIAYQEEESLFTPKIFRDGLAISDERTDSEFLYWKTEDHKSKIPELDEVKDEVVRAWKMREALKDAEKDAEKMAATARKSKESLADAFPKKKSFQTAEFSWMTYGATPFGNTGMPSFSPVFHADGGGEVQYAGDDFMETVFGLAPGGVGVAVDEPKETVYVARMISDAPAAELRREMFLQGGLGRDIVILSLADNERRFGDWYRRLEDDWGFSWKRSPGDTDRSEM